MRLRRRAGVQSDFEGVTFYTFIYSPHDVDNFWDFYSTVADALNRYYGRANIEQGDKAMKVRANDDTPLSIDADVVACAEFRQYHSFNADGEDNYKREYSSKHNLPVVLS